jgi:small subunit ribosomal protein S9
MATKKSIQQYAATGRRKNAVAQVRLLPGTGKITVNSRAFEVYFPVETMRNLAVLPLTRSNLVGQYEIQALCSGGGLAGQAGAICLGVARALIQADPNLRPTIKTAGLLTRDSRMKERKKSGQPGARKRFQFSKR